MLRHSILLDVADDTYQELLREALQKSLTPERVAADILDELLPDPLLRLAGSIKSPLSDVAARHDEYIGEAIYRNLA